MCLKGFCIQNKIKDKNFRSISIFFFILLVLFNQIYFSLNEADDLMPLFVKWDLFSIEMRTQTPELLCIQSEKKMIPMIKGKALKNFSKKQIAKVAYGIIDGEKIVESLMQLKNKFVCQKLLIVLIDENHFDYLTTEIEETLLYKIVYEI